jgi:hypothetical protein
MCTAVQPHGADHPACVLITWPANVGELVQIITGAVQY